MVSWIVRPSALSQLGKNDHQGVRCLPCSPNEGRCTLYAYVSFLIRDSAAATSRASDVARVGCPCTYLKPARKKGPPGKSVSLSVYSQIRTHAFRVVSRIRRSQAADRTALPMIRADDGGTFPHDSPIDLTGLLGMHSDEAFAFSPLPPELFVATSAAPAPLPLNLDLNLPTVRTTRYDRCGTTRRRICSCGMSASWTLRSTSILIACTRSARS